MAKITLELPAMYGDHHVVEVRRLLFELPGIADVYASSSFHVVEVEYDEDTQTPETIESTLNEAGYLGDIPMPVELGVAAQRGSNNAFFRHTAAYEQTGKTIGFAQTVPTAGRALWPCPGMGAIENEKE